MKQTRWQQWRDMLICIICMGFILWAAWNFLRQFIDILLFFSCSMAIAFLLIPVVDQLEQWKIPRLLATLIAFLITIALLAALGYTFTLAIINQVQQFSTIITTFIQHFPDRLHSIYLFLLHQGIPAPTIQAGSKQIQVQVYSFTQQATTSIIGLLFFLSNTLITTAVITFISFYLILDGKRIRADIFAIIPQRSRPQMLQLEEALNRIAGNYIRGQLSLNLIIGLLVGLICILTGLGRFALIFSDLGFLFETIPMLGPLLAAIAPLSVSLLLPNPFPRTLWVLIGFLILQALENNMLRPRIIGDAVGFHPIILLLALFISFHLFSSIFGSFGGVVGALVATPIAAIIWTIIVILYRSTHNKMLDMSQARRQARRRALLFRPSFQHFLRTRRLAHRNDPNAAPIPDRETETLHPANAPSQNQAPPNVHCDQITENIDQESNNKP
jgi:predicted PurR-regulated permease PerM